MHSSESTVSGEKNRDISSMYGRSYKPGDMVLIRKGKFLYGDEKIEKEIDYDFNMDVFPVTNRQYKEFIDETGYDVPSGKDEEEIPYNWNEDDKNYPKGLENHPVVLFTHHDAEAFCKWRSQKEGTDVRLPTKEEWEKAARGEDGRVWPWGDDFDFHKLNCADYHVQKKLNDYNEWKKVFDKCFYEKNRGKALTSAVGQFSEGKSPFGCYDMAGNVWELTSSFRDDDNYPFFLRGGSLVNAAINCRCAYRFRGNPLGRLVVMGFRCASTVKL